MIPWYWLPIAIVGTFILTYSLHRTWQAIIRHGKAKEAALVNKAKLALLAEISDVKTRIDLLYEKADGAVKTELGVIREQIKKVLP